jgi:CheY-like chemotaxis protein
VTEVSGRGVGMDVVANQIAAIGGKLRLDTDLGAGTMFTIEVPAPQLLISCVLLMVGDRTVALPTADILETILLDRNECQFLADRSRWQITTDRGISPGFSLATYWHQFSDSLPENAIGLRCRLEDNSNIWLIADDLISQSDLSINPLPSPLIPPPGLIGVSLQPDGRLISVLDPVTLTDVLKSRSANPNPTLSLAIAHPATTTILVVDDAALMRRRLSASLTTAGFVVHTCEDGLEALKWLQTNELPSLMITDMEMPNMDGLTLIDRCRQTAIDIPILIVSSRLWEDWGKEAQRVGANGYLNKGFTTEQLLATVNGLLARHVGIGGRD